MKTLQHNNYLLTLNTDINGSLHMYLIEEDAFLMPDLNGGNMLTSAPQTGVTFYCGATIKSIRAQIYYMLQAFEMDLADKALAFFDDFISNPDNLKYKTVEYETSSNKLEMN